MNVGRYDPVCTAKKKASQNDIARAKHCSPIQVDCVWPNTTLCRLSQLLSATIYHKTKILKHYWQPASQGFDRNSQPGRSKYIYSAGCGAVRPL